MKIRQTGGSWIVASFLGMISTVAIAGSGPDSGSTTTERPYGDRQIQQAGVMSAEAREESRPPGTTGALSQQWKQERERHEALELAPSQRLALASPVIMVHTELLAAKDEINGIRSELKSLTSQSAPDPKALHALMIYERNLNADLKVADAQETEFKGAAGKVPVVTGNDDFQRMDLSVQQALKSNRTWQDRASSDQYWKDPTRVNEDLDQLSKQLEDAIDESQSFGSEELRLSFAG